MHETVNDDFSLKRFLTPVTCIILIGFIVFLNSLFNAFVYDDDLQISSNPLIHSLMNIPYFFMGGSFFDAGTGQLLSVFYRPFASTVFTLLYPLSGGQPFLFHLFQLSLHITNTCLVYFLFRRFFKQTLSFFLALVFLVHPINQEAVVYISDLQENLFFFFGMMALLISTKKIASIRKIILVNIFLLLALFSKETAFVFGPIILIYLYIYKKQNLTKNFALTTLGTIAFYIYLRFFVVHTAKITEALAPIMQATLPERLITLPAIFYYYLKTFFFPSQLALGHSWVVTSFTFEQFYLPIIVDLIFLSSIFFCGIWIKHNTKLFRAYLLFISWFILGFAAHAQIVPLDLTVADRWFYFPSIGIIGMIGILLSVNWQIKIRRKVIIVAAVIIIILLSFRTMVRNTNWVNMLTLCLHDLQIVPEAYNVQSACGSELLKIGEYEKAKKHYAKAAALAPTWGSNWYQYGLSYEHTHDIHTARTYYRKSIHLSNEVNAYVSLAASYLKYDNNPQEAKKIVEEGLKNYPHYQQLQLYLAVCEYRLNNKKKALAIASKSYQVAPSPESRYVLTQITHDQEISLE